MEYKTEKNLQQAFAGESQANRRYLFFAEKAEQEGYPQLARLFRATAEAETVHARNHFNAMDGVGSTRSNLLAGATGEHYEFTRMYPPFIADAEAEENERALASFKLANAVEEIHYGYFEKALKALEAGETLKDEPYFVCQVCGNTVAGAALEMCPICGSPQSAFKRVT
ncbi:MAG: rubrerythrin family protein [Chloroflexi bacterium]|nr:rubrerythrin family protein [Chloroflexota bacterium]